LDSRFIVVVRVREDVSGGMTVASRAVLSANLGPGRGVCFFFAEAQVVLTETGVQTSDQYAMCIELFDVRNRTWMSDYICIASIYWDTKVCDVEHSWSAAREKDRGIVMKKLEGENVFRMIFSRYWVRTYPASKCEEEG
jgi:hypothetical protein